MPSGHLGPWRAESGLFDSPIKQSWRVLGCDSDLAAVWWIANGVGMEESGYDVVPLP
jgi:hypothetical protein